jgi:hypothetical protein
MAAAILAAIWLYPVIRRRKLRMWSLALMLAVIAMSTFYHFKWLTNLAR